MKTKSKWTLIATGSELNSAYIIGKKLKINVISAPDIMKNTIKINTEYTISLEAASTFGWSKFAKYNIGVDHFGYSAPLKDIQKKCKLDDASLLKRISKIIIKK